MGEDGDMTKPPDPHYRHRFPAELICHAVWFYHVFSLSFRDVELILAERGVSVGIHRLGRGIEGRTSRVFRQEFQVLRTRLPTLPTNSYFVSTVGVAPLAVIKQHIENQKHV
jgi:hypothetical protein